MIIYYERYVVIQPGIAKNAEGDSITKNGFLNRRRVFRYFESFPVENQYLDDSDPN